MVCRELFYDDNRLYRYTWETGIATYLWRRNHMTFYEQLLIGLLTELVKAAVKAAFQWVREQNRTN